MLEKNKCEITFHLGNGETCKLIISAESSVDFTLAVIDSAEAESNGESPYQLKEGCAYEYQINPAEYQLEEISGVVQHSKIHPSSGRITPNTYVGTLSADVIDSGSKEKKGSVTLEVRSVKTSYRTDYRFMLEEITEKCTDLLMLHTSPVAQQYSVDASSDASTLYQRFAFIKSILESPEFLDAVHRIILSPVTAWEEFEEDTDIRRAGRPNRSFSRQLASASNRINLPDFHALTSTIAHVPKQISIARKHDTLDTAENRFVKHALTEFCTFCSVIREQLSENKGRSYREALFLEEMLEELLSRAFFRELSIPDILPLNSPVLQRKEGYREVLRVWLMFDLASKLIWRGGDDVYAAGKRDVAILYEYWLFFKMLDLLKEIFVIEPESIENLIKPTSDGLGLTLRSDRYFPLKGVFDQSGRKLNVQFAYQRFFSGDKDYPAGGSWTLSMQPDYTLSLWPDGFSEEQAEEQELIVHVHFDAKYKVKEFRALLDDRTESGEDAAANTDALTGKRDDLLKMHAYKDAIRRTAGSYALYPGTRTDIKKGFHELIPGLGAFPVRPSADGTGIEELKQFILDVVHHVQNRASQREQLSYRIYDIHNDTNDFMVRDQMPERYGNGKRVLPPGDTSVLIGYYKDAEHYRWINKNGLYNARMNSSRGSIRVDSLTADASYLLLHAEAELHAGSLWRIKEKGPRVFSKDQMLKTGYTRPSGDSYLVYRVEMVTDDAFDNVEWDLTKLEKYESGRKSAFPFAVTLTELMLAKVVK